MEIAEVKKVQIPFTLYDFFGYLLHGITFPSIILLSFDVPRLADLFVSRILGKPAQETPNFVLEEFIRILHQSPWFISILCLLISYVLGHVIAAVSSFFLERLLVSSWLGYPTQNMLGIDSKPKPWFFKNFRHRYSEDFITNFKREFENRFRLQFNNPKDVFYVSFEYVAQNCPAAFARTLHFLNLYGFSRNLCMTFLVSALALFMFQFMNGLSIAWALFSTYLVVAGFFFWNYLKLFRRLDDEVYRGFYAHAATPKRTRK